MANKDFTKEETEELKQLFANHDKNKDGRLNTDELLKLILSVDGTVTEDEILFAIETFDTDGDGALDEQEYLNLMSRLRDID
ncbi:hypothetical protein BGZ93_002351 [Podila epicladia]|nr:hypothetical protein BGZ92_005055 [Podila epicladia]KAG0082610.1 hypothetical protein BGZ93_002351 [Podila epicladia]